MARAFGIPRAEAVARISLDLVYHETAGFWAADIYYGHDSFWWLPDAHPRPLPPP